MMTPMKKNIFPCCILKRENQGCCSGAFTITDRVHSFISEFIPCKVEALVSQKTQRELQTREQEEVAEINQAQHSKLLHSCKDIFTAISGSKLNPANGSNGCTLLLHRRFQQVMSKYLLSFVGGSFTLVTAEKWNKDKGFRRSLESPNPEEAA